MKLGILTYHRAENYGALLQAYALRTYLKRHVEKVEFVDYWPDYHREHYKVFSWKKLKKQNFKNRIILLCVILIIVLILEFFYFKDIQNSILNMLAAKK